MNMCKDNKLNQISLPGHFLYTCFSKYFFFHGRDMWSNFETDKKDPTGGYLWWMLSNFDIFMMPNYTKNKEIFAMKYINETGIFFIRHDM